MTDQNPVLASFKAILNTKITNLDMALGEVHNLDRGVPLPATVAVKKELTLLLHQLENLESKAKKK